MKYFNQVTKSVLFVGLIIIGLTKCNTPVKETGKPGVRWSKEKAWEWYNENQWIVGCNYNPRTAINQLEMWQEDYFVPDTIDQELAWAHEVGFNTLRVYLHHKVWKADADGFKKRLDTFLSIADKYQIKTMFVLFDDVWNPENTLGKQPDPKPGVHNSGWVQDPGKIIHEDTTLMPVLEQYVKDILGTFADDKRIIVVGFI